MVFATLLTVAPLSSFAAETEAPVKNNVVNFSHYKVENVNRTVSFDEDGEVTAQGWKKMQLFLHLGVLGKELNM